MARMMSLLLTIPSSFHQRKKAHPPILPADSLRYYFLTELLRSVVALVSLTITTLLLIFLLFKALMAC